MSQPQHVQTSHPARKLGRLPARPTQPRLRLGQFLTPGYTGQVPNLVDYLGQVDAWPMLLNDELGDCTAAAAAHQTQAWTRYAQPTMFTATDQQVIDFYAGSTGYVPGDPSTDQGGVMQDVLSYWRKTGLAGHQIAAYFEVDPDDFDEIRAALYLFGGCYIGMAFPAFAMDQFDRGQAWDVSHYNSRIEGGHCVHLGKMSKGGNLTVTTWGRTQEVTPAFWRKYMGRAAGGEVWCPVSFDWIRDNQAPQGLDVAALNDAFKALTGEPGPFPHPAPAPTPAPQPQPAPVPVPTDEHGFAALLAEVRADLAALLAKIAAILAA